MDLEKKCEGHWNTNSNISKSLTSKTSKQIWQKKGNLEVTGVNSPWTWRRDREERKSRKRQRRMLIAFLHWDRDQKLYCQWETLRASIWCPKTSWPTAKTIKVTLRLGLVKSITEDYRKKSEGNWPKNSYLNKKINYPHKNKTTLRKYAKKGHIHTGPRYLPKRLKKACTPNNGSSKEHQNVPSVRRIYRNAFKQN